MKRIMVLGLLISTYSCSLLLPYEEEPLCKIGKEGGYCGSIMDVYQATLNAKPERRKPVLLKPGKPCHNCTLETYERENEKERQTHFHIHRRWR